MGEKMKKGSLESVLKQMTPKQVEGLRILTESGLLEELVKDMVLNVDLPHACESTKTKSKDKTMTAMEESLVEQGFSLEEARDWLSRN